MPPPHNVRHLIPFFGLCLCPVALSVFFSVSSLPPELVFAGIATMAAETKRTFVPLGRCFTLLISIFTVFLRSVQRPFSTSGTEMAMELPMRFLFPFAISLLFSPLFAELAVLPPPPPPLSPHNLVPIPAIFCTFTPCRTLLPSPATPLSPPPAVEIEPPAVTIVPPAIPAEVAAQPPAVFQSALPPPNLPPARPIVFDLAQAFETAVPPPAVPLAPPPPSLPYFQPGMFSAAPPPLALPAPLPISTPVPPPAPAAFAEFPLTSLPPQLRPLLQELFLVSPQAVPPEPLPIEPLAPSPVPALPLLPSALPPPCPPVPPPSHPCHLPHLSPFLPSPALFSTSVDFVNALAASPPPAAFAPTPAALPLRYLSPAAPPPLPTPISPLFNPYKKVHKERGKRNGTKGHKE
ncbi:hypothetical protein niasHT_024238 [Heterodera trifolii]|uniref:Uncharacterized protein n=1 Tax=Heterodera trifolii TaxID=157864 RepID=A0ABD2JM13_9BILA